MTIKEFILSLPRPWKDIKEYIDSRIQYSKILLSRSLLSILNESIDTLNKKKQDKLRAGKNITIKKNVISAKGRETPVITIPNSMPSLKLLSNVAYVFEERTNYIELTFDAPIADIINEYHFFINCGGVAPYIMWPIGINWDGGNAPTISANKTYEVSIVNNIAVYLEI